jgi:hypothetical protein
MRRPVQCVSGILVEAMTKFQSYFWLHIQRVLAAYLIATYPRFACGPRATACEPLLYYVRYNVYTLTA